MVCERMCERVRERVYHKAYKRYQGINRCERVYQ